MKKWLKLTTIGLSTSLMTSGAILGALTPQIFSKKNGVSDSNPEANWNSSTKLNYVALGDSETAGYNRFIGRDYLSYSDFLAKDLENSGNLNQYNNYAVTGDTMFQSESIFSENAAARNTMKKADLISMTISADDFLSFVKMLDFPFTMVNHGFGQGAKGTVIPSTSDRNKIFGPGTNGNVPGNKTPDPSSGFTPNEVGQMFKNSTKELSDMVSTGEYSHFVNVDQSAQSWVFQWITSHLTNYLKDLHFIAPHAQVVFLAPAFPFITWPKEMLNEVRADLGNKSLLQYFDELVDAMQAGVNGAMDKPGDKWITFKKVDSLPINKTSDPKRDKKGNVWDTYIKNDIDRTDPGYFLQNPMDNSMDIHPTVFGYELIGNSLYSSLANPLQISKPEDKYTLSTPVKYNSKGKAIDSPWSRLDEDHNVDRTTSDTLYDFFRSTDPNNKYAKRSSLYKTLTTTMNGQSSDTFATSLATIQDWTPIAKAIDTPSVGKILAPALDSITSSGMITFLKTIIDTAENEDTPQLMDTITNALFTTFDSATDKNMQKLGKGIVSLINATRWSKSDDYLSNLKNISDSLCVIEDLLPEDAGQAIQKILENPLITNKLTGQATFRTLINLALKLQG